MATTAIESSSLSNVSVQSAYRTTCDNCMRLKVRCSKDHPSCHRCLGQGVTCIYSQSRRLKKIIEYHDARLQTNPAANGAADFSHVLSSRNEREQSTAAPSRDDSISPPSVLPTANDRAYPSPWSFFGNDGDVPESVVGMESMEGLDGMEGITQPAAALTTLPELAQNKIMDWPTHQWSRLMETSTGEALVPMSPDTSLDFISSIFASAEDNPSSSLLDTRRGTSSTPVTDTIEDGSSRLGCAWVAASVLQSLESPGTPLNNRPQASSIVQGRLRRNLDKVISTNKAVMALLHRISGCTCSVPGNHLVIISAVLFMVLAWYEACLDACDHVCEQGAVKSGPGDSGAGEMRHCDGDVFEVEASTIRQDGSLSTGTDEYAELVCIPPIQVGSLQLGVESRRQVVAQIVLTEVAKVTAVIESLTERPSGRSSSSVGANGYQELEAQLQFTLRAALQTRIEKITQAAERASK